MSNLTPTHPGRELYNNTILSFFQAEDGIRYWSVTGVQTCVLFFSSRRRHTRLVSDWSSDVCSSDLMIRDHQSRILLRSEEHTSELQSLSILKQKTAYEIGQ